MPLFGKRRSAMTTPDACLRAEVVRHVAFGKPPIGKRGYNEDELDAFLDRLEKEIRRRATGADT